MHKFKLDLEDDYDFLLFGISCHLKDYRVAWYLNQSFKLDLVRSTVTLGVSKGEIKEFSVFRSYDETNRLNYLLLDNYSEDYPLIKSLKQYDYFIIIEGYLDLFDADNFKQQLRAVESIQIIADIETDVLKKYQYTLFEANK